MRLRKDTGRISISDKTEKIEYFRILSLEPYEIEKINKLAKNETGFIDSSEASEALLLEILEARQMGQLLYPDRELDKWSGYVRLEGNKLFLV